jgi:hypothetical protein
VCERDEMENSVGERKTDRKKRREERREEKETVSISRSPLSLSFNLLFHSAH